MKLAPVLIEYVKIPRVVDAPEPVEDILEIKIKSPVTILVFNTVTVPLVRFAVPAKSVTALAFIPMNCAAPDRIRFPLVAVIFPAVAVTEVAEVIEPTVVEIFPAEATIFPAVAVTPPAVAITPVAAVTVDPAAIVVVEAMLPGAINVEGTDQTIVLPEAVVVI